MEIDELLMQHVVVSTDDVPEPDRFSYWREAISERFIGVVSERGTDKGTSFNAKLSGSISNSLILFRYTADGHPVFRRARDIARLGWDDYLMLYRERGAGAWFDHAQREFVTHVGDLALADPTLPFATEPSLHYDHDVCFLPRSLLESHLPVSRRPRNLVLSGSTGLAGIVSAYFDGIVRQIDVLNDHEAGLVAENFCRLLAIACGAPAGEHTESLRSARLEEATRYVDLHLADPGLAPEKVAAALKISVRQLHLLFEPSGSTFAQYVMRRRLEECRAAIINSIVDRSITDIALAWGFNSLRTFHRNFRQAFGVTAGELREKRSASP